MLAPFFVLLFLDHGQSTPSNRSPDRAQSAPPSQWRLPTTDCHWPNPKPPLLAAAHDRTLPLQRLVWRFSSIRFISRWYPGSRSASAPSDNRYSLGRTLAALALHVQVIDSFPQRTFIRATVLAAAMVLAGCKRLDDIDGPEPTSLTVNGDATPTPLAQPSAGNSRRTKLDILICGDQTRHQVRKVLLNAGFTVQSSPVPRRKAAIVIIAEDANTGPWPIHREAVLALGRLRQAKVLWLITNVSSVDDVELLMLEAMEAYELMAKYDITDSHQQIAFDQTLSSKFGGLQPLMGWKAVIAFLRGLPSKPGSKSLQSR